MAKKDSADRRFSQDVHIRITEAEADRLQKKADELGVTLSKAARILMFKRIEQPAVFSEKERQAQVVQNLSALKSSFKKANTDISKLVAGYEKSLTLKNRSGDPAVSTGQTIRTVESVIFNQMKLQDGLNEVIRQFGGNEVHVAAKPPLGSVVGDYIAGSREEVRPSETKPAKKEREKEPYIDNVSMANITIDGTIVAAPETYQNGKYEMIRIVVQVEERDGSEKKFYRVDCVGYKNSFTRIMEYLKPDKKVLVAGDHRYTLGTYNGNRSESQATILVSNIKLL